MDTAAIALIFPGQGSQTPGMGKDIAENYPSAKELFEQADAILGRSLSKICWEGSEEELRQTSNTQPALYVAGAAALAALRAEGLDGSATAGHSLGEYTALYAAGVFDFETGLRLVDARARGMEQAGRDRPGAMAALLGLADEKVEPVCLEASSVGIVVPANWNCPQQVVISGDPAAIDRGIELAKAAGAKKAMKLNVAGAFHSPLMAPAVESLRSALGKAVLFPPRIKFVANFGAHFLSDPEVIRLNLLEQLISPVRWTQSVQALAGSGITTFLELGAGSVLTALLKRIDRSLAGQAIAKAEDIKRFKLEDSKPPSTP